VTALSIALLIAETTLTWASRMRATRSLGKNLIGGDRRYI
jgi:hypothetical protein